MIDRVNEDEDGSIHHGSDPIFGNESDLKPSRLMLRNGFPKIWKAWEGC